MNRSPHAFCPECEAANHIPTWYIKPAMVPIILFVLFPFLQWARARVTLLQAVGGSIGLSIALGFAWLIQISPIPAMWKIPAAAFTALLLVIVLFLIVIIVA